MDTRQSASKSMMFVAASLAAAYGVLALPAVASGAPLTAATLSVSMVLGAGLVALSAIDLTTLRLPDAITLPLAAAGLAFAALLGWEPTVWWRLSAAAAGYGAIWLIGRGYESWRGRAGIGLGDAKLLAVAGAWLGLEGLPSALLYACAGALLMVGGRAVAGQPVTHDEKLPFGPFIAAGIWLVWLYGPLV